MISFTRLFSNFNKVSISPGHINNNITIVFYSGNQTEADTKSVTVFNKLRWIQLCLKFCSLEQNANSKQTPILLSSISFESWEITILRFLMWISVDSIQPLTLTSSLCLLHKHFLTYKHITDSLHKHVSQKDEHISHKRSGEKLASSKQIPCWGGRGGVSCCHLDRQGQVDGMIYKEESVKVGSDKIWRESWLNRVNYSETVSYEREMEGDRNRMRWGEKRDGRMRRMMEGIREEWRQSVKGRDGGRKGWEKGD